MLFLSPQYTSFGVQVKSLIVRSSSQYGL
uniref:Uncharacterized protein n=1 Tax=Lepeophtheirus salmonis TaxID=72036 RepID=A0A0K2U405_LEPSM